jgi:hypothetical protein
MSLIGGLFATQATPVDVVQSIYSDESMPLYWVGDTSSVVTLDMPIYITRDEVQSLSMPTRSMASLTSVVEAMVVNTKADVSGVLAIPIHLAAKLNIDVSSPMSIKKAIENSGALPLSWIQEGLVIANRTVPVYILDGEGPTPPPMPVGEAMLVNRTDEYQIFVWGRTN